MTVRELIHYLLDCPMDDPVQLCCRESCRANIVYASFNIDDVRHDKIGKQTCIEFTDHRSNTSVLQNAGLASAEIFADCTEELDKIFEKRLKDHILNYIRNDDLLEFIANKMNEGE